MKINHMTCIQVTYAQLYIKTSSIWLFTKNHTSDSFDTEELAEFS